MSGNAATLAESRDFLGESGDPAGEPGETAARAPVPQSAALLSDGVPINDVAKVMGGEP